MAILHIGSVPTAIISLLVVVALILSFVMLGSHWIRNHIYAFAAESWVIGAISVAVGIYAHIPELYAIAALTVVVRGTVMPLLLLRISDDLDLGREFTPVLRPSTSLLVGAGLVVFSYAVADRIASQLGPIGTVALLALTAMFGLKLIGFAMLVLRSGAFSNILGLLVIENGIFLGSQILVPGMPLLLELVILFDLLLIVSTFGLLVRYLKTFAGTTDTRDLNRLVG
ncbi:MAG: hydrogenase [Ferrimicrobium sp.]